MSPKKQNDPICTLKTNTDLKKVIKLNQEHIDEVSFHPGLFDSPCDSSSENQFETLKDVLDEVLNSDRNVIGQDILENSDDMVIHDSEQAMHDSENFIKTNKSQTFHQRGNNNPEMEPGPLYYVNLLIGEDPQIQSFLVDSGSTISTIQLRNLKRYCTNKTWDLVKKQIKTNNLKIHTAAGTINSIGDIYLPVYVNNLTYNLCFRIMQNDHTPNILGNDLMKCLDCELKIKTGEFKIGGIPVPTYQQQQEDIFMQDCLEIGPNQIVSVNCSVTNLYTEDNFAMPNNQFQHNMIPQILYCDTSKTVNIEFYNDTDEPKIIKKGEKIGSLTPYFSVSNPSYPLVSPTAEDLQFIQSMTCNSLEECKKDKFHRHSIFQEAPLPKLEDLENSALNQDRIVEFVQKKLENQTTIEPPDHLRVKVPSVQRLVKEISDEDWRQYITDNLDWTDSLCTEDQKKQIIDLLMTHRLAIFHSGCGVTTCTNFVVKPEYYEGKEAEIRYKKIKPYRLPPDLINRASHHIRSLLQYGVLQRQIPRCGQLAPALIVFDSQKRKSRLVIDMRSENSLVKIPEFKTCTISECIAKLNEKYLTSLDLSWSFYSIVNSKDFQNRSIFQVGHATYSCCKASMGSSLSPYSLALILDTAFNQYPIYQKISLYLDDCNYSCKDFEETYDTLKQILLILISAGFVLNIRKTHIFCSKLHALGWEISNRQKTLLPHHTRAITQLSPPKNFTELASKRSLFSYFGSLVPSFSLIAGPLFEIQSNAEFKQKWSELHNKCFDVLKFMLTSRPVLLQVQTGKPLFVFSDASSTKIAAFVAQKDPDTGLLHPVLFYSKSLTISERRSCVYLKELKAIYSTIKLYSHIFRVCPALWLTDHEPILNLFSSPSYTPSDTAFRWVTYISSMPIKLQYIRGKNNIIADIISRSTSSPDHEVSLQKTEVYEKFIRELKIKDAMKVTPAKKVSGRKSRAYTTGENEEMISIKSTKNTTPPTLQSDFDKYCAPVVEKYNINMMSTSEDNPLSWKTVPQILQDFQSSKAARKVHFNKPDQIKEIFPENYFYRAESKKFPDCKFKVSESSIIQTTEGITPEIHLLCYESPVNVFGDLLVSFQRKEYHKFTEKMFVQNSVLGNVFYTTAQCNSRYIKLYNAPKTPKELEVIYRNTFKQMQQLNLRSCIFAPIFITDCFPQDTVKWTIELLKKTLDQYLNNLGRTEPAIKEINLLLCQKSYLRNDLLCKTMNEVFPCTYYHKYNRLCVINAQEATTLRRSARLLAKKQAEENTDKYLSSFPDLSREDAMTLKNIIQDNIPEENTSVASESSDVACLSDLNEFEDPYITGGSNLDNFSDQSPITIDLIPETDLASSDEAIMNDSEEPLFSKDTTNLEIFQKPFSPALSEHFKTSLIEHVTNKYQETISHKELVILQNQDPFYGPLIRYLRYQNLPANNKKRKQLLLNAPQFCVVQDILYRFRNVPDKKAKFTEDQNWVCLCVPERYILYLLQKYHDKALAKVACHSAAITMYNQLSQLYWFPSMFDQIQRYVRACETCLEASLKRNTSNYEPGVLGAKRGPLASVAIDITYMPTSPRGNKYILVLVDTWSSFTWCFAMKQQNSNAVISCLEQFLSYAHINSLHSDRGSCFISSQTQNFLAQEGITQTFTSSHRSTGNAQCEKACGLIKKILLLSQTSNRDSLDWDLKLRKATFVLNSIPHHQYKVNRYELLYNCTEQIHQDKFFQKHSLQNSDISLCIEDIVSKNAFIKDLRFKVLSDIKSGHLQDTAFMIGQLHSFKESDHVAMLTVSHHRSCLSSRKLVFSFISGYQIVKLIGLRHAVVKHRRSNRILPEAVHLSKLKKSYVEDISEGIESQNNERSQRVTQSTQTDDQEISGQHNPAQLNFLRDIPSVPLPQEQLCQNLDSLRGLHHEICLLDEHTSCKFHVICKNRLQIKCQIMVHFSSSDFEKDLIPDYCDGQKVIRGIDISDNPVRIQKIIQANMGHKPTKDRVYYTMLQILQMVDLCQAQSICVPFEFPNLTWDKSVTVLLASVQKHIQEINKESSLLEVYIACPTQFHADKIVEMWRNFPAKLLSCWKGLTAGSQLSKLEPNQTMSTVVTEGPEGEPQENHESLPATLNFLKTSIKPQVRGKNKKSSKQSDFKGKTKPAISYTLDFNDLRTVPSLNQGQRETSRSISLQVGNSEEFRFSNHDPT